MSAAAVTAVRRFALQGDTAANQELMHLIDHSLDVGGTNAAQTVAPQLLLWSLTEDAASASTSLYIAVLNRHFCLRVVLNHLAQPMNFRPCGLEELQQLYAVASRQTQQEAARRQLTQCVACLLIVQEDYLAERLGAWIGGGSNYSGEISNNNSNISGVAGAFVDDRRMALHVFMAVVDLLVDRRVPIGPIRRATQRRKLQEHLSIVLQSPLTSSDDMPLLVRVTDTAVRFLLEAMHSEPQEVAATFWAALPSSSVWRYSIACLSRLTTPCSKEVLDFVCNVLRCLTLVDSAAESLLLDALPAVLQPVTSLSPSSATVEWETMSRVIAAALEASTEAIITKQSPGTPLFCLFSSAAERLVQMLQAPDVPSSAVNHICEGISALTQVLQPAPIPVMEPSDDPEDFQEIVECMTAANATKQAALKQLRPFLASCEAALATRLVHSNFAAAEWDTIAEYVSQRLADGEEEDFQIVHGEVELALYTTYERLSRLLGPLTAEALRAIVEEPSQQCLLVTVSAELTLQWLQSVTPCELLPQAALLPCTVVRYIIAARNSTNVFGWSADASLSALNLLLHAVSVYNSHADWEGSSGNGASGGGVADAVIAVSEAAVKAVVAVHEAGFKVEQLRELCTPLVSLLWQCLMGKPQQITYTLPPKIRHTAAHQLSTLLQRGVVTLPDSAVNALMTQDVYTQAILFASSGATSANMDTLEVLEHTLNCLGQLSESACEEKNKEEETETHVLDSLVPRVQHHVEKGEWPAEGLVSVLVAWHTRYPKLTLCFLKLATTVPTALQPSLLLDGLARFFSLPEGQDISTANLVALLSTNVVEPIASTAVTALAFIRLLGWLLQPHPAFTVADGGCRVLSLATCGRLLSGGGHVELATNLETLLLCVKRWQEFAAATALSRPAAEDAADDDVDDCAENGSGNGAVAEAQVERHVLEELAVWGRCVAEVPEVPTGAPGWLVSMQMTRDDYERMEVLKNL